MAVLLTEASIVCRQVGLPLVSVYTHLGLTLTDVAFVLLFLDKKIKVSIPMIVKFFHLAILL